MGAVKMVGVVLEVVGLMMVVVNSDLIHFEDCQSLPHCPILPHCLILHHQKDLHQVDHHQLFHVLINIKRKIRQ